MYDDLLAVTRICVVQHTECAMIGSTDDEMRARIGSLRGVDASGWDFLTSTDQLATLRADIELIESCPLLPPDLEVGAFIFDVHSSELVAADEGPTPFSLSGGELVPLADTHGITAPVVRCPTSTGRGEQRRRRSRRR